VWQEPVHKKNGKWIGRRKLYKLINKSEREVQEFYGREQRAQGREQNKLTDQPPLTAHSPSPLPVPTFP